MLTTTLKCDIIIKKAGEEVVGVYAIPDETLERLRQQYPSGQRVVLVRMNDPHNVKLRAGCKGTVRCVDDVGTIHVEWDCGSRLGVVYGEDFCETIKE